jgi:hypothetical protein
MQVILKMSWVISKKFTIKKFFEKKLMTNVLQEKYKEIAIQSKIAKCTSKIEVKKLIFNQI